MVEGTGALAGRKYRRLLALTIVQKAQLPSEWSPKLMEHRFSTRTDYTQDQHLRHIFFSRIQTFFVLFIVIF